MMTTCIRSTLKGAEERRGLGCKVERGQWEWVGERGQCVGVNMVAPYAVYIYEANRKLNICLYDQS